MGMAASQARLLTITARLADNELKSQSINNAKMRLARLCLCMIVNYLISKLKINTYEKNYCHNNNINPCHFL